MGEKTGIRPDRGDTALDFVELPPLGRRIEWPTIALAIVIYGLWFLTTFFWRDMPWWALSLAGAWVIAWQMNLQHEIIHGHPTPNRLVNDAIGIWPLSLWLPFSIFRATHLRHHQDANLTDPFEDPESYYGLRPDGGTSARSAAASPAFGRPCSAGSFSVPPG